MSYYKTFPGKGAAYNKALADITIPLFDELVKRKVIVSHLELVQSAGARESTNLIIIDGANWASLDSFRNKLDEVSQAASTNRGPRHPRYFPELREALRNKFRLPAGQR